MVEQPQFIREFSRDYSVDERKVVAESIKEKRRAYFSKKSEQEQNRKTIEKNLEEQEKKLEKILKELDELKKRLVEINEGFFNRLVNHFFSKKVRVQIKTSEGEIGSLQEQQALLRDQIIDIGNGSSTLEMIGAEKIIRDFYRGEIKKWENAGYTREELERYFSEENLSALSMSEYVLLLKRFPSEMVTHVTRQGIRDHIGGFFHSAGQGEYASGFMDIVGEGKLKSALAIKVGEKMKDEAVAGFLGLAGFKGKKEALASLRNLLDSHTAGSYADRIAIHFAAEEVADCFYGSERGNEIFFAFPSQLIAAQCQYTGDITQGSGGYWNDKWVWTKNDKGLVTDAGLVFLPADAQVDVKTGSRYEIDPQGNPIINRVFFDELKTVVEHSDFMPFARDLYGKVRTLPEFNQERFFKSTRSEVKSRWGITDDRLAQVIIDGIFNLMIYREAKDNGGEDRLSEFIEAGLKDCGIYFVEASETIPSSEFWRKYFSDHPEQQPSKMVFYTGDDPTEALKSWRQENGIIKSAPDKDMGFPENSGSSPNRVGEFLNNFRILDFFEHTSQHFQS